MTIAGERHPIEGTTGQAFPCIARGLRAADPVVLICSGCKGVLVPRRDELALVCSTCPAKICGHCEVMLRAARLKNPAAFVPEAPRRLASRERIDRLRELLGVVLDGLAGKPFRWGEGQREAYVPQLRAAGVDLVTRTMAEKLGHRLKLRAEPIGRGYFGAPLKRVADLFVLGLQTTPREPEASAEEPTK